MEPTKIGNLIHQSLNNQVPALREPEPSKTGLSVLESKALSEIDTGIRIDRAPLKDMEAALRWCMIKVGMRSNNLPGPEESMILYHHLVNYYGGHTIGEMKLAFDMAIAGQLAGLTDNDINPYESFDCRYVSRIMNSFRTWSRQVYQQHRETSDNVKELPTSSIAVDWREQVQVALDAYLLDKHNFRLWTSEMYDQVAIDGFISALSYHSFMDVARRKLCGEIQKDLAGMKSQTETDVDSLPSSKYKDFQELEQKVIEYKSGTRDIEVRLFAKQLSLRHYFSYLKSVEVYKIYVPPVNEKE